MQKGQDFRHAAQAYTSRYLKKKGERNQPQAVGVMPGTYTKAGSYGEDGGRNVFFAGLAFPLESLLAALALSGEHSPFPALELGFSIRLCFLQKTHPVFQPFDRGFGALAFGFPLIPAFQEEAQEFTGGAAIGQIVFLGHGPSLVKE